MWMLNYPFPYDWHEMQELFSHLGHSLANVLQAKTRSDFSAGLSTYLKQRREVENTLSPDDYRYLSFQMWQEGISRYTEYRIAKLATKRQRPSKAFRTLKGLPVNSARLLKNIRVGILSELTSVKLARVQARFLLFARRRGRPATRSRQSALAAALLRRQVLP